MEYLNPPELLHYTINQYRCDDMEALKKKLLQFPAGSTFDFAWDFTAAERDEVTEIGTFLRATDTTSAIHTTGVSCVPIWCNRSDDSQRSKTTGVGTPYMIPVAGGKTALCSQPERRKMG